MSYGQLYPTVKTQSTAEQFIEAAIYAWIEITGTNPTKNQICLLYAKYAHETGNGKYQYNWNCGNIKKTQTDNHLDGYYQLGGTWEIVNGKKVVYNKTNPTSYFRNYKTQLDGLKDYLKLVSGRRYKTAWSVLVSSPDILNYCKKLKESGYYTDTLENYYGGVNRYYQIAIVKDTYEKTMQKISKPQVIKSENEVIQNVGEDIEFTPFYQIEYSTMEKDVDETILSNNQGKDIKFSFKVI
jgi:hypothetical protein